MGYLMSYHEKIRVEPVWRQGYSGRGVGVAVLDTGCFPHPDLAPRLAAFVNILSPGERMTAYDDNGHGTHIAGIIGGNGRMSAGKYRGMAPGCHLVAIKVLDSQGNGSTAHLIEGIQWLIENYRRYNIRIVNISVGGTDKEEDEGEDSPLVRIVDSLWDRGLVVVTAAGNNGPGQGTVTTPGISRKVITVGCCDEIYMPQPGVRRPPLVAYSGRGPTRACVIKPEVIAPGNHIISCCCPYFGRNLWYAAKSGTSMATPLVSGAVALLLEKHPEYTNVDVKLKLRESCRPVPETGQNGWGLLQTDALLEDT